MIKNIFKSIFSKKEKVEEVKKEIKKEVKKELTLEEIVFNVDNFNAWCKSDENKDHPEIYLKINNLSRDVFIKYIESYGVKNGGPFLFNELSHVLISKLEEDVRIDWRAKKDAILEEKRKERRRLRKNKEI